MQKHKLKKDEKGIWSIILPLKEGRYEYKFIIDGQWMEGANLVLTLKKDKDTGKLYIPKGKPGISTSYSGKIKFSGKYLGMLPVDFQEDQKEKISISTPINHLDLDWYVTPTKETDIFFRTEVDTQWERFNLKFDAGQISFYPTEKYLLRMFYNYKFLQFDDPLKVLDKPVGLRYDGLYFIDELNIHKAYGLDSQGLFLNIPFHSLELSCFYANVGALKQDDLGFRLKSSGLKPVDFGVTFFSNRGKRWYYDINDDGWFPDPGYTLARATYSIVDVQPWYKGFIFNDFTSFDSKFYFLPDVFIFGEFGKQESKLLATHWNESANKNTPIDKTWPISKNTVFLGGMKGKFLQKISAEISYQNVTGDFQQSISSDHSRVEFEKKYPYETIVTGVKFRYQEKFLTIGFGIENRVNKKFNCLIDAVLSPYIEDVAYFSVNENKPYFILKEDFLVTPLIKFNFREETKIDILGRFHNYKCFQTSKLYDNNGNYITDIIDHNSLPVELKVSECITKYSYNIQGPWYFETDLRYYAFYVKQAKLSKQFFSHFTNIKYKLKENFILKIGYGIDPEGTDEDLLRDFDLREEFLYNTYVTAINSGSSVGDSILFAEEKLQNLQRISIRAEVRF